MSPYLDLVLAPWTVAASVVMFPVVSSPPAGAWWSPPLGLAVCLQRPSPTLSGSGGTEAGSTREAVAVATVGSSWRRPLNAWPARIPLCSAYRRYQYLTATWGGIARKVKWIHRSDSRKWSWNYEWDCNAMQQPRVYNKEAFTNRSQAQALYGE